MSMYIMAFILGVVVTYLLLTYKEGKTTYTLTRKIEMLETRTKSLETSHGQESSKLILLKARNEEIYKNLQCHKEELTRSKGEFDMELDKLQDHCARLREQQIELKDKLASKRPVINISTPIPVSITPTQADPKLMNKLKKQIKEVSQ